MELLRGGTRTDLHLHPLKVGEVPAGRCTSDNQVDLSTTNLATTTQQQDVSAYAPISVMCAGSCLRSSNPAISSPEIESISLHNPIPIQSRLYGLPWLSESFRTLSVQTPPHRVLNLQLCTPSSLLHTINAMTPGSNRKNGPSFTVCWSLEDTHSASFLPRGARGWTRKSHIRR